MLVGVLLFTVGLELGSMGSQGETVGRIEIELRESDVVFAQSDPLEVVVRVAAVPGVGGRVDVAWLELELNVAGELEGFIPFMVVADAVLEAGPGGGHESASPDAAREIVLEPGSGRLVRLDATRIARNWREEGGELLLRIRVVEPAGPERPEGGIQITTTGGTLGKAVLVTR